MIINPLYLLSFISSATIAFFTSVFIVHFIIYFFQIRQYRIRYLLRLFPFACVILNFLFLKYNLSKWLNPLSCPSCIQKMTLNLFFPDLKTYLYTNNISLIDHLSYKDPYSIGFLFIILFGSLTIFMIGRKLLQIFTANRYVTSLVRTSIACTRAITNSHLKSLINRHKTKIAISQEVQVPMATHINTIVMPAEMTKLSQEEFEAVIAHELEHIRWEDPQLKPFINIYASIFWWIPIKGWIKKMEEDQELGCDQGILKHNLSGEFLATALIKVGTHVKNKRLENVCSLGTKKKPLLKRVRAILNFYPKEKFTLIGVSVIVLGLMLMSMCLFIESYE